MVLIEVGFFWVDEGIRDQGIVDEGIHDPFPDGWLTLRLLICICLNERLTQSFFVYLCLSLNNKLSWIW